ncbi:GTP cyclohydrolase FolE2, partial [Bienertia sinuspersici]
MDDMHTMGLRSYATLPHKLKHEDLNKKQPRKAKVYRQLRIRNPKKLYKARANDKDRYDEVFKKPEHDERPRLLHKGITMSKMKKVADKSNIILPLEFIHSIQRKVQEKIQEANPRINLVIPYFFDGVAPANGTSSAPQANKANGINATQSMNR